METTALSMMSFTEWLNEGISNSNTVRAAKLIRSYLQKKTGMKFMSMPGVETFKNSLGRGFGIRYFFDQTKSIRFNWLSNNFSSELTSVDVWDGLDHDPKFNVEFDHETSLMTVLPFIADMLSGPITIGEFVAMPADTLNENTETPDVQSYLTEGYSDAFDGVIGHFKPNTQLSPATILAMQGSRGFKILTWLRTTYPKLFDKNGRFVIFKGSKADIAAIVARKNEIVSKLGGSVVKVKKGGKNETYKQKPEIEAMDKNIERVAYEDQLHDLEALVRLVVKGASNSLFVAGRGGTGKTHSVEETLNKLSLYDGDGYFKSTGSTSPAGLYRLLFKYQDGVILFDDSDGTLADVDARNLIKAATDTKKTRKLVWNKVSKNLIDPDLITDDDLADGKLPTHFEFTGRIIFISNLSIEKLDPDGAIRTRALMISIDPTNEELVKFMYKMCQNIELDDGLSMSNGDRKEVVDLLSKSEGSINLRKLVRGLNIRAASQQSGGVANWERLIKLYA